MKKFLIAATAALFSLAAAHAGAINDKCPASGKDVDAAKSVKVDVNFCCEKCKGKFDAAPAEYLKLAADAEEGKCPLSGKPVKAGKTSTVEVGVCCEKCEAKVKADPKAFLGKVEPKKG